MKWNIIAVPQQGESTVWELWIDGWRRGVYATWYLADIARKRYKQEVVR